MVEIRTIFEILETRLSRDSVGQGVFFFGYGNASRGLIAGTGPN